MSEKWIDKSWYDVLTDNVDDALLFFIPEIAAARDYSKKTFTKPKEFPAIDGVSDKGMRNADLVLSVPLKTGVDQNLVFHIEQQHAYDRDFPFRMFQTYYRMIDRFRTPVTSLAIFTGNTRPVSEYSKECYGTELFFRYNVYHVRSADVKELENDPRIFALVVLAARRMLDAGGDPKKRGEYSLELLRLLRERGYDEKRALSLQSFIYRILQINDERIDSKVREEWKMQLVPIDEVVQDIWVGYAREQGMIIGRVEGRVEGLEEKALEVARSMHADGFSAEVIQKFTGLDKEIILARM